MSADVCRCSSSAISERLARRMGATFAARDSRSKPARAETETGSVHESGGAGTAIAQPSDISGQSHV